MKTTTTDGGAEGSSAAQAQPQDSAAVTAEDKGAQVITKDENGTPTLEPVTSQAQDASEAVSEESQDEKETQANSNTDDDVQEWAKSKNLPLDDPVKLAKMYRDAEKRMHEANQKAKEPETAAVNQAPVEYTGNQEYDSLAAQVNTLLIKNNVSDFFSNHPEAREFESKMAEIVTQRPHLQNDLDALYALARSDPGRESELKQQGGREALTNLAQKQQQIPPGANATNSGVYESQGITPANVYEQIDKHDQEWFQANYKAINKAISGK